MPLYCYNIITGEYDDIEYHTLGHENRYSQEEFGNICLEIMEKHGKKEHDEGHVPATLQYYNNYVYRMDAWKLLKYLVNEYGFIELNIPYQAGFLIKPVQSCEPKPRYIRYVVETSQNCLFSDVAKNVNGPVGHVDCHQCKWHNYDSFFGSDDDWEVCDKGHELDPDECEDFEEL